MLFGFLVLTAGLFGANIGVLTLQLRARIAAKTQTGSLLGAIVGGFAVGCPSCGAYLLSIVGVSSGLAVLPFGGLEL